MVVREDLPLGVILAQTVHAAGESSTGDIRSGTHAVVLAARNEAHLLEVAARLQCSSIAHVVIFEPDPPYCGAAMAIGLLPLWDRRGARRVLSRLPLFKRSES